MPRPMTRAAALTLLGLLGTACSDAGPSNQSLLSFNLATQPAPAAVRALLAAECAGIAAQALKALGRTDESAERRLEAEAGFRRLGATSLLERLRQSLD